MRPETERAGRGWRKLCELASKEQNPEKLLESTKEINRLLEIKEQRLIEKLNGGSPTEAQEHGKGN